MTELSKNMVSVTPCMWGIASSNLLSTSPGHIYAGQRFVAETTRRVGACLLSIVISYPAMNTWWIVVAASNGPPSATKNISSLPISSDLSLLFTPKISE